ncbi:hypothetical protein BDB00DRAFT_868636 [Zychaea mexicana]|uniref:uncharacterized protein n=1 Tax=Zychaea mexicana TaxID=64656 RepID=UPI0022FDED28|nr:uncharacterized protein BDB00DRAFT_868636 [Zychaea mexicana]KAI9497175.1 hypothetical protein BDB00DRAFT_868636 [Zychaea mexicana]
MTTEKKFITATNPGNSNSSSSSDSVVRQNVGKIPTYHYVRPLVHGIVGSAAIFTVAGLVQIMQHDPKTSSRWSFPPGNITIDTNIKPAEGSADRPKVGESNIIEEELLYILGLNAIILGFWKLRGNSTRRFMETWFQNQVLPRPRPLTLLTASFSHQYFLVHFFPNMALALATYGSVKRISSGHEMAAVYLSAGVMGFAASHVTRLVYYRYFMQKLTPSLGASGSVVGIMAVAYSNFDGETHRKLTRVDREALLATLIIDVIGLFMRWSVADHAAHLGGAAVGFYYANYGRQYVWNPLITTLQKARDSL